MNLKKLKYTILFLSILFLILPFFWIKLNLTNNEEILDSWNILFVVDVSKSINVIDFKDNNSKISRLDWIKKFVNNFLTNNSNNSFGLIIFAWEALELLPFTSDISLFKTIFSWIDEKNLSKSWTEFWEVFIAILWYFSWEADTWTVVIFTDWWDEDIVGNAGLHSLQNQNIKILIVWVWTTVWWYIPIWVDIFWKVKYKIYSWKQVLSKLNEESLKNITKLWKNINYIRYEDISHYKDLEKLILENTKKVNLIKKVNWKTLTRELVFISFILFLLFLWLEYLGYRR